MNFYKLIMAAVMLAAGSVCVAAETATDYEKNRFSLLRWNWTEWSKPRVELWFSLCGQQKR